MLPFVYFCCFQTRPISSQSSTTANEFQSLISDGHHKDSPYGNNKRPVTITSTTTTSNNNNNNNNNQKRVEGGVDQALDRYTMENSLLWDNNNDNNNEMMPLPSDNTHNNNFYSNPVFVVSNTYSTQGSQSSEINWQQQELSCTADINHHNEDFDIFSVGDKNDRDKEETTTDDSSISSSVYGMQSLAILDYNG